jgi:hypothetical protein
MKTAGACATSYQTIRVVSEREAVQPSSTPSRHQGQPSRIADEIER